jgi:hypothetical protein
MRALGDNPHAAVAKDRVHSILVLEDLAHGDASVGWFNTLRHAMKIVA